MNTGYLGKNANISKVASQVIREFCLKNQIDRADFAVDLGIQKGTLDNKLKPSVVNNSLNAEEIIKICELTNDNRILEAMCKELGMLAFNQLKVENVKANNVINALIHHIFKLTNSHGKLAQIFSKAIEDGEIDYKEEKDFFDMTHEIRKDTREVEELMKLYINKKD